MVKKVKVKSAADIAIELLDCRKAINEWKAIEKPLTEELKTRIKVGEKQDSFKITTAIAFKVADTEKAMEWAQRYAPQTIVVDATAARRVFLGDIATGSMGTEESNGFTFKETERLTAIGESEE